MGIREKKKKMLCIDACVKKLIIHNRRQVLRIRLSSTWMTGEHKEDNKNRLVKFAYNNEDQH